MFSSFSDPINCYINSLLTNRCHKEKHKYDIPGSNLLSHAAIVPSQSLLLLPRILMLRVSSPTSALSSSFVTFFGDV